MKATRIRSITVGLNPERYNPPELTERLTAFYEEAETAYQAANFPVQTRRLTLPPMNPRDSAACYKIKSMVETLSRITDQMGVRWICLPLKSDQQLPAEIVKIITNIIHQYPKIFAHFMVADEGVISNRFSLTAASVVLAISRLSSNGFDNFRVGVGANIKPNTPYFPFSYHQGETGFSLAVELIELLIQTVSEARATSLSLIREVLLKKIIPVLKEVDSIGKMLEEKTGFQYKGQDISIAPYPDEIRSVASLIEMLGPLHCGQSGTLMVTALLTDVLKTALKRAKVRHTGFNGVMFSPLEDLPLAKANNQHHLSVEKLMLYSAVCGCGIDMVPVPGDMMEDEINNLILDVSSLSTVLSKPLGVRILPIPMKVANERTNFNHDFLTNTRVMRLDSQRLTLPLSLEQGFSFLRFEKSSEENKELCI
jgi:uncharacterized protein (UPF0210 family)